MEGLGTSPGKCLRRGGPYAKLPGYLRCPGFRDCLWRTWEYDLGLPHSYPWPSNRRDPFE